MKNVLIPILALCLCIAGPCFAAGGASLVSEPGYVVTSKVDWGGGTIAVEIVHALNPAMQSLVRAKGDAETEIQSRLSDFVTRAIADVTVDSSHTFGDLLGADPELFARVSQLARGGLKDEVFLTPDFSSLTVHYSLSLFGAQGIASPLYPSRETPIRRRLGYVTTRRFTGLLISASGILPESGTARRAAARPALFPRLWDERMNLVLDKEMCSPQALSRWGMVGYAQGLDDPVVPLRAGVLPLRLAARAVFGDKATDIVISTDGVRQLLALPENIALLQQGRIVIVYNSLP
jgi:hypothetical protein